MIHSVPDLSSKREVSMRISALSLLLLLAPAIPAQTAPKATQTAWQPLFNGNSLAGWHSEGDAKWQVEGGAISAGMTGDGWLRSDKQYGDFILRIEFRNSPKGNSGIFVRTGTETKSAEKCNPESGYEVQINNEDSNWATGSIEDVIQRIAKVNPAPNQWHKYEIAVQGDHFVVHLDGRKVLDGRDSKIKVGYIGLQHHKDMPVAFRAITIQSTH